MMMMMMMSCCYRNLPMNKVDKIDENYKWRISSVRLRQLLLLLQRIKDGCVSTGH